MYEQLSKVHLTLSRRKDDGLLRTMNADKVRFGYFEFVFAIFVLITTGKHCQCHTFGAIRAVIEFRVLLEILEHKYFDTGRSDVFLVYK